jgi:hypothetical protein
MVLPSTLRGNAGLPKARPLSQAATDYVTGKVLRSVNATEVGWLPNRRRDVVNTTFSPLVRSAGMNTNAWPRAALFAALHRTFWTAQRRRGGIRPREIPAHGEYCLSNAWSLAEISAAILSYNEPLAPDCPKPRLKGEGTLNKQLPIAIPCGRMRRRDDQKGPGPWPIG